MDVHNPRAIKVKPLVTFNIQIATKDHFVAQTSVLARGASKYGNAYAHKWLGHPHSVQYHQ